MRPAPWEASRAGVACLDGVAGVRKLRAAPFLNASARSPASKLYFETALIAYYSVKSLKFSLHSC